MKSKDIILIALFTVIISICAWINIPSFIPFTMQTFAIFLTAGCLCDKRGVMAVILYVILGLLGFPVFAGFNGGISVLFSATGGYIIGFIPCIIITIILNNILDFKHKLIISMIIGLIICYLFGTLYFVIIYTKSTVGFYYAFTLCVLPYIVPDILKIILANYLVKRLKPHLV